MLSLNCGPNQNSINKSDKLKLGFIVNVEALLTGQLNGSAGIFIHDCESVFLFRLRGNEQEKLFLKHIVEGKLLEVASYNLARQR